MSKAKIVVIGAGLQGASVALALAAKGYQSTLIEEKSHSMQSASLRNEGKIHLGFVYALDAHGRTKDVMLEGALSFSSLIDAWCGPAPWFKWKSEGFCYAVMPESLLSADILETSYRKLSERVVEITSRRGGIVSYMGSSLSWLWKKSSGRQGRPIINGQPVADFFETEEVAVDPRWLSKFISDQLLKNENITLNPSTRVLEAVKKGDVFELVTECASGTKKITADIVVNCAWADRLRIDSGLGIQVSGDSYSYRVKYQIIVKPLRSHNLRAVTMVQGPYGDVVPWRDGTVYVSWYPTGRTYFSSVPPDMRLEDAAKASQVAHESLEILGEMFPELCGANVVCSLPGVIMARGHRDVDTRESGLHERFKIGPQSQGNWWTIDTGKLTTAPLFAELTSRGICEQLGR